MVSNEPGMGKELVLSGSMMCSALVMNHESLNVLETQLVSMTATMRKMLESLVPHVNSHPIFLPFNLSRPYLYIKCVQCSMS